jgi:carbonic anhydrase/acetyltransferase-like protein (isoleucine patch superfamily)
MKPCTPSSLAPVLYRFRPFSGTVGHGVIIHGMDLCQAKTITFNGVPAVIVKNTAFKIRTVVPAGATTGPIRVTTGGGTVATAQAFTVFQSSG